jgi:hypothetical protein
MAGVRRNVIELSASSRAVGCNNLLGQKRLITSCNDAVRSWKTL